MLVDIITIIKLVRMVVWYRVYAINIYPNFCGAGSHEIEDDIKDFNAKFDILMNKKLRLVEENDVMYYTCCTENRFLSNLCTAIFERYGSMELLKVIKMY